MVALLGSIPSPHSGVIHVGPLLIHMYGVMLLLGIAACVWLTARRWRAVGGEFDLVVRVTVWGVAFGVIGARIYHDLTSWSEVPSPKWQGVFEVWRGGLGIWGGILFGVIAGVIVIRSEGERALVFLDAAAPGLLLAQGIGRIGNWWNQELFGGKTKLPWGLQIDDAHLPRLANGAYPVGVFHGTLFQPTFLYELIWDVIGCVLLIWIGRRFTLKPPALFALYVSYYCFGRFFEELMRIDPSLHIFGLRLNAWVSIFCFVVSTGFFIWWQVLGHGSDPPPIPKRKPKLEKLEIPKGPKMTIPRGRVR
jgi:phosphatidylglycerol---prolipoprotein diacylglyceryl transferase